MLSQGKISELLLKNQNAQFTNRIYKTEKVPAKVIVEKAKSEQINQDQRAAEEKNKYDKAIEHFKKAEYREARILLEIFYTAHYKTSNLTLLRLLAVTCDEDKTFPQAEKEALAGPLLQHLFLEFSKEKQPPHREIVNILCSLAKLYQDDTEKKKKYSLAALKKVTAHPNEFTRINPLGKLDDDLLRCTLNLIYNNIANCLVVDAGSAFDPEHKKQLYHEACNHFELAFNQQPDNIENLLKWVELTIVDKNMAHGIKLLESFENKFHKNKSYWESLRKLYHHCEDDKKTKECAEKSAWCKTADEFSYLFDYFNGKPLSQPADTASINELMLAANFCYHNNQTAQGNELIDRILEISPHKIQALQLRIFLNENNTELVLNICNQMLEMNPDSIFAILKKAQHAINNQNPESQLYAYALLEKVYALGHREPFVMRNLISLSAALGETDNLIMYALSNVEHNKLPYDYLLLALVYHTIGEHRSELDTLQHIQKMDPDFEKDCIACRIISALFVTAKTREQFNQCAKKLMSYLKHHPEERSNSLFTPMIECFKQNQIEMPLLLSTKDMSHSLEKKQPDESSLSKPLVPADIKQKIISLLNLRFEPCKELSKKENKSKTMEKDAKLYKLGEDNSNLYAYISSKARLKGGALIDIFEEVLGTGRLKSAGSKGQSTTKQLHNGTHSVKSLKTHFRLLEKNKFLLEDKVVIEFEPIVAHSRLNK